MTEPRPPAPDVGRTPPHNPEAERGVLGAVLLDGDVFPDVAAALAPEDFHVPRHGEIFRAMRALYDRQEALDAVTVREELRSRGLLESVGGASLLAELAAAVPSVAHASHYVRIVRGHATRQRLIRAGTRIVEDAYGEAEDPQEALDRAEQAIFEIAGERATAQPTPVKQLLSEVLETIDRRAERKGAVTGVATGFAPLDEYTDGLHPGELVVLAARPSVGKTSLAMNIAYNVALGQANPVVIFSLETSKQQLVQNLLCMAGRVDSHFVRRATLSEEDHRRLLVHADPISRAPLHVFDTEGRSILDMRAIIRRLARRERPALVIVDYLQLVDARLPQGKANREQEVSYLSRSFKAMARDVGVPVLALSQLNRGVEERGSEQKPGRPRMSDLRESGAIEQDADVVLLMHRDDYYRSLEAGRDGASKTEIIVAKQRHGPTGVVKLAFLRRYLRFEPWSDQMEPASVAAGEEMPEGL